MIFPAFSLFLKVLKIFERQPELFRQNRSGRDKCAQPHTGQPHGAESGRSLFQKLHSMIPDDAAVVGGIFQRYGAGNGLKIVVFDLQCDVQAGKTGSNSTPGGFPGKGPDEDTQLHDITAVFTQSDLSADGFGVACRFDFAVIDAPDDMIIKKADFAEKQL